MKTIYLKLLTALLIISITSCSKEDQNVQPRLEIASNSIDERMSLQSANANQQDFILGINGHPLSSNAYVKTPADKQIELIKNMGLSIYRFDVQSMSDGRVTVPYLFEPLLKVAEEQGIKLLPVLTAKTLSMTVDTATSYKLGRTIGANFAEKYGNQIEYYALGYELESKCILAGKSGMSVTHYSQNKFNIIAAYLKGMDEGIKSSDAGAKTLINATWTHFGYIQLLESAKVNFDIVAWHWYSNYEKLAVSGGVYNIPDISLKISSITTKPIWFTEVRAVNASEQDQNEFFMSFLTKCRSNPQVKAVLFYELFDEPEKGSIYGKYGVIKWQNRYTDWQFKLVANNLIAAKQKETPPEQEIPPVNTTPETPTTPLPINRTDFIFGVNGHPLGQAPYTNTSPETQINLLKDMGMTWYRIDVHSMSDGRITVPYMYNPIKAAADKGGVKFLPVLYSRTLKLNVDEKASYEAGKALGGNFAAKYADHFDYYELANELDLQLVLKGSNGFHLSGELPSHYDQQKFRIIAAYLKGMNDGVKLNDPGAKTMINTSWMHYAYLHMLEDYGVNYDIVAWHWYYEMDKAIAGKPYNISDITLKIASLFPNKPIWFTEVNTRYNHTEQQQNDFLKAFYEKCKNNPQVKALLLYELFDEPEKGQSEGNYGIIKWKKQYTEWELKLAAKHFVTSSGIN